MGSGASADIGARVKAAPADDVRSAIAGLDAEEKIRLRNAVATAGASQLFGELDNYSAFIYSVFPGTYYRKRCKETKHAKKSNEMRAHAFYLAHVASHAHLVKCTHAFKTRAHYSCSKIF